MDAILSGHARRGPTCWHAKLIAYEIDLEHRAAAPTPGIADVLRDLAARHRLVFASDMYLPAPACAPLDGSASVILRGRLRLLRARTAETTGRLFEALLERENLHTAP